MILKINIYTKKLYKKSISNAQKLIARKILFFFAFIESIFFPIPVDPLLAFLVLANKEKYFHLTILCTFGSVLGGLVGWFIGHLIGPNVQDYLIEIPFITNDSFTKVLDAHKNYGSLIVFLGAFTPLPFKIISITSGFFGINFFSFLLMSILGRGLRFFIISFLIKVYGDSIISLLGKKIFLLTSIIGVTIFCIIYLYKM